MNVHSISDLNLHDSNLVKIVVELDTTTLLLDYIDDYETCATSRKGLIFLGCTELSVKTRPGYAGPDPILRGDQMRVGNKGRVRIETNTTASIIELTADSIELLDA